MYFNLKTTEINPDVAKYQPGGVREGIVFYPSVGTVSLVPDTSSVQNGYR